MRRRRVKIFRTLSTYQNKVEEVHRTIFRAYVLRKRSLESWSCSVCVDNGFQSASLRRCCYHQYRFLLYDNLSIGSIHDHALHGQAWAHTLLRFPWSRDAKPVRPFRLAWWISKAVLGMGRPGAETRCRLYPSALLQLAPVSAKFHGIWIKKPCLWIWCSGVEKEEERRLA